MTDSVNTAQVLKYSEKRATSNGNVTFSAPIKSTVINNTHSKAQKNGLMRQDNILMVRRLKAGSGYVVLEGIWTFCLNNLRSKTLMFPNNTSGSQPVKFGRSQEGAGDLLETGLGLLSLSLALSVCTPGWPCLHTCSGFQHYPMLPPSWLHPHAVCPAQPPSSPSASNLPSLLEPQAISKMQCKTHNSPT